MTKRHKTLVIHIGDHKTGSTSIQTAFAQGNVTLKGRSVFYSAKIAHNMLKTQCQAYARLNKPAGRKRAIAVFEKLARKIRKSDADFCLISAEALEGVEPTLFHDVVTSYFAGVVDEVRVVAYVRPHAARLLSNFSEQTKIGGFSGGLEPYVQLAQEKGRFYYQPRFAAWRAAFGDAFMLRPMIRDQLVDGSVVHDFIRHGFGETGFQVTGNAPANESLSLQDLMRLKVLQSCCTRYPQKLRHALGWEFSRVVATLPPCETRTKLTLHKALAEDIHDFYLNDARALDAEFFDGVSLMETELDKAVTTAPEAAQPVEPEAHFSASELRALHLLSEMVAGMLENGSANWVRFLRSKRFAPGSEESEPG